MIKVDGGFAKVVNVLTAFSSTEVEITTYVKMSYADDSAKLAMVDLLEGLGYKVSGIDTAHKKTTIDPFELVVVAKEDNQWQ